MKGFGAAILLRSEKYPRDPDILKTVCVVKVLSVVNLLRVVIHY